MPRLINQPTVIKAAGNKPKIIREMFGRVNSTEDGVSIAHMISPEGWVEPGQTPEFDEYTLVLRGMLRVDHRDGSFDVQAGQGVHTLKGEWVRYGSPAAGGAEYIAVCLPAFSPETVHRDA
jgi:mannose-6-phosphate isomerase-like protein (cupin superfamily)